MSEAVTPLVLADSRGKPSSTRTRLSTAPLLWRVFAANAALLTLAFIGLVVAPVTVSAPVAASELAVLAAELLAFIVLNLALLRPAFRPLDDLAETMRSRDPLSRRRRAAVPGDSVLAALADAFNEMLERLERERRDSARKALAVQKAERRRVARELHDEVGQTLTGVMLQIEALAPLVTDAAKDQLEELRETHATAPRRCGASPADCGRRRWTSSGSTAPWRGSSPRSPSRRGSRSSGVCNPTCRSRKTRRS